MNHSSYPFDIVTPCVWQTVPACRKMDGFSLLLHMSVLLGHIRLQVCGQWYTMALNPVWVIFGLVLRDQEYTPVWDVSMVAVEVHLYLRC